MITLSQIEDYISTASADDLKRIISVAQIELPKRPVQQPQCISIVEPSQCTTIIKDFCSDPKLLEDLREEVDRIDLPSTGAKDAPTQWLSNINEPYIYPDKNPIHKAKPISDFPNICKMLDKVNQSSEVVGPLDGCLITRYNSDKARLRFHQDNEPHIDQSKSICSFTIGFTRTIEFMTLGNKSKMVASYEMEHNSLVVMRPGAQQIVQHGVRPAVGNQKPDTTKVRYSLSFRAVAKPSQPEPQPTPAPPAHQQEPKETEYISLVAGDSYAARLKSDLLGKKKIKVVNIAEGGAKIPKVEKQLTDFKAAHPDTVVNKIVISVGTNDIRNEKVNTGEFRGKFKGLCNLVNSLYPNSIVFFQTLLPLPLKDSDDFTTNRRVYDMNKVIYTSCRFFKFHMVDAFHEFLKFKRKHSEPIQRFDRLFENKGIHPNASVGMGVLARLYIGALHKFRANFCPLIHQ